MGFNSGFKGLNVVSVLWSFSPPTTTIGGRYGLCCLALSCPVPVLLSGWPDLVQIKVLDHRFEVGLEVWLWYVYRVYLKCLDKLQERVPYIKTSKEVIWMYVRSFRGITPTLAWPEDFFYVWGKWKTTVCSSTIENGQTFRQHICDIFQTIYNRPGTSERARQSMIRRVHVWIGSGGGYFGYLFLKCNLINNIELGSY